LSKERKSLMYQLDSKAEKVTFLSSGRGTLTNKLIPNLNNVLKIENEHFRPNMQRYWIHGQIVAHTYLLIFSKCQSMFFNLRCIKSSNYLMLISPKCYVIIINFSF